MFYGSIVSFVILIYQSTVLAGLRQGLRFDLFALRDQLRRQVIDGKISESNEAFDLLHDRLNFMCSNLHRFDLASALLVVRRLQARDLEQIQEYIKVMETSSSEVRQIYHASVKVTVKAIVFNSLMLFVLALLAVATVTAFSVGVLQLREALTKKAKQGGQLIFFKSSQVAI